MVDIIPENKVLSGRGGLRLSGTSNAVGTIGSPFKKAAGPTMKHKELTGAGAFSSSCFDPRF